MDEGVGIGEDVGFGVFDTKPPIDWFNSLITLLGDKNIIPNKTIAEKNKRK